MELARAEAAMDEEDKHPSSLGHRTTSCEQVSALDHARWFWESIYRTSESGFCPRNHSEAMRLPQAENVRLAEINEYNSHIQNGTFGPALDPSQFAPGPALKAVWVYSRSKKDPGAFKARVVIQGFLMQQGLHFNDVHAPVPAVTSFRVFMLGVAVQGRALEHWDVKTAFLTTDMDCQIDVTLPEAFNRELDLQPEARRGTERHRVFKVISGCPQGSRLWHADISGFLAERGFIPVAPQEECLLIERANQTEFTCSSGQTISAA